jgi:hypothetical protein
MGVRVDGSRSQGRGGEISTMHEMAARHYTGVQPEVAAAASVAGEGTVKMDIPWAGIVGPVEQGHRGCQTTVRVAGKPPMHKRVVRDGRARGPCSGP